MAEALAVLGCAGSICNVVDSISKTINIITDLRTRWEDADLTLLSLASQLTALRAASTKIQEWVDYDLHDAHHQLVMDLEVSISCSKLLISKVESFFSDLAFLTEKPLDLRNKFKVVFGSAGPESVQKLIERQTSALTLLLTACNCKTLSEQQRHLETTKSRKVLNRANADSISLCVLRDSASLTSRVTDNLSKISRVFDFDRNVFSTKVYERAFRGSLKSVLRKEQQQTIATPRDGPARSRKILLLGEDEIGKDRVINTVHILYPQHYTVNEWVVRRLQLQKLCLDLMCNIITRGTPDWNMDYVSVLLAYSLGPHDDRPQYTDALDACAMMWWSALRLSHRPDPDPQGYLREKVNFQDMIFYIDIIAAGGLNIYCGNAQARLFVDQMERVLPLRLVEPRYAKPIPADYFRARAALNSHHTYRYGFQTDAFGISFIGTSAKNAAVWPSFQSLQSADTIVFVFDLQDYGNAASGHMSELSARLESTVAKVHGLNNRGTPEALPFMVIFTNFESSQGTSGHNTLPSFEWTIHK